MAGNGKSPEEWEAGEHIDALKGVHAGVRESAVNVCAAHGPIFEALLPAVIWIIRHMDLREKAEKAERSSGQEARQRVDVRRTGPIDWKQPLWRIVLVLMAEKSPLATALVFTVYVAARAFKVDLLP